MNAPAPARLLTSATAVAALLAGSAALSPVSIADEKDHPPPPAAEMDTLRRELKDLQGLLPDQAHVMTDVAYHFSNLWFAGQAKNWPLAEFYVNETRSHLRWAVRVKPVRPLTTGIELKLGDVLAGIEQSSLKEVQDSIKASDVPRFATAYKRMLASCYSCHVAAEKPYLRLHLPERPAGTMIEFDPSKPGSPEP